MANHRTQMNGPADRTTKHEAPEFTAFMRRILRSFGRRATTDTELLRAMMDLRAELDATIKSAAQGRRP